MIDIQKVEKIYLSLEKTDFRLSINGLSLIVQNKLKLNPFYGSLFIFCDKSKEKVKILYWDRNGFWLFYKRLEKQKFQWPKSADNQVFDITLKELNWLLDGLSLTPKGLHKSIKFQTVN